MLVTFPGSSCTSKVPVAAIHTLCEHTNYFCQTAKFTIKKKSVDVDHDGK